MKIGILTFHEGINHGAYMQAFSTYQFLLQNGYNAEIINYKNKKHYTNELRAFLINKNPRLVWSNIKKIKAFKKDHSAMNLKPLFFDGKRIKGKYDYIIIGSDIVWNFKLKFIGSDPIYFGKGLEESILISYAPSFGNLKPDILLPSFVKEGIKKFKHISVRDKNSAQLVKRITDIEPKIVLDPTFLIDTKPFEKKIDPASPYLLVYAYFLKENEIASAIEFAHDNKLKIVSIGYNNKWADKNIITLGPFEWLSYFKHATYILTSTFHGTIFSIKYEKNFATSLNDNIKNKTMSLISKLDLESRFVENSDVSEVLSKPIDYKIINQKLTPLINNSKKFLLKALEN